MTIGPSASPPVGASPPSVWSQSQPSVVPDSGFSLDPWRPDDARELFDISAGTDIQELTSLPAFRSVSDARTWIEDRAAEATAGKALYLAIRAPTLVGSVHVIHFYAEHLSAELGYWLTPNGRGRGIATRSLISVSRWCLTGLHWNRLELLVGPGNESSEHVAMRAGYVREGILRRYRRYRGVTLDLTCFSLIQDDLATSSQDRRG